MKKFLLMTAMLVFGLTFAVAQNQAEIKFDKVFPIFNLKFVSLQEIIKTKQLRLISLLGTIAEAKYNKHIIRYV